MVNLNLNYSPIPLGETKNLSNDEWLMWREHGPHYKDPLHPDYISVTLGGSSVAAIFGDSPWKSRLELYHEKSGIVDAKVKKPKNQEILDAGHDFEEGVANTFLRKMKKDYGISDFKMWNDTVMYQHPLHPYMVANMDRRLERNGQQGILECKTTSSIKDIALWKEGICPKKYEWQCRFYMAVMNVDFCYIVCVWGFTLDECAVILIKRDLEVEAHMIEEMDKFIECCEFGIEPEPQTTHMQVLADYYSRLYGVIPDKEDTAVELANTIENMQLFEEIRAIKEKHAILDAQMSVIEETEARLASQILAKVDGASTYCTMRVDDETVWSVKAKQSVKKDGFDLERFKADHPSEYKEYCEEKFNLTNFKKKAENKRIAANYVIKGTVNPEGKTTLGDFTERKIPVPVA